MTLSKINDYLTKGMIGTFVSILPLSLLTLLIPVIGYVVAVLLMLLFLITITNLIVATILLAQQINSMMDNFFKQYEQGH